MKKIKSMIDGWVKVKRKKKELTYSDNEFLVQDGYGSVLTQEQHNRMYGFCGYPTTHTRWCVCLICAHTRSNYDAYNLDCQELELQVTRGNIVISDITGGFPLEVTVQTSRWLVGFAPKKWMKVHKLQRHNLYEW